MDTRRHLSRLAPVAGALILLGGCALFRPTPELPVASATPETVTEAAAVLPVAEAVARAAAPPLPDGFRPYLAAGPEPAPAPDATAQTPALERPAGPSGRGAIALANRTARAEARTDAFVGGVLVFAYDPGRVFEVWTAPLRVTLLTLAPGETVTAKAAGDTVRWQIGESLSGSGPGSRTHVMIKPLATGLETNLVLTTNQRVYMIALRSGRPETFNAAVAWDEAEPSTRRRSLAADHDGPPPVDVRPVRPEGVLDARYRVEPRGRAPSWTPTAVFNDGVRTFLALPPDVAVGEAPVLFVVAGGERQIVNYRQAGGLLIVDRLFDEAELRLGDRRPQIVRIRRLQGAVR